VGFIFCDIENIIARDRGTLNLGTGWNRYIHGSVAGLPILRGRCNVKPYAGVSPVPARGSPKRRYVALVDMRPVGTVH